MHSSTVYSHTHVNINRHHLTHQSAGVFMIHLMRCTKRAQIQIKKKKEKRREEYKQTETTLLNTHQVFMLQIAKKEEQRNK